MKMRTRLSLFVALLVSLPVVNGVAATVNWIGAGDGASWNDAANWTNNTPPGPNDDIIINVPGTPTVRITTGNVTVRGGV
jgi:hypothetical protein